MKVRSGTWSFDANLIKRWAFTESLRVDATLVSLPGCEIVASLLSYDCYGLPSEVAYARDD